MSHSPDHVESQITQQNPEAQQIAAAARRGLANEAAVELSSPPGTPATSTDTQEQGLLAAQQGLKDLAAGDAAKGILELMQASVARPDLVRNQEFIGSLHQVAPEVSLPPGHSHEMAMAPTQGQQALTQEVAQQSPAGQPDAVGNPASLTSADSQVLQQQSMSVAQQGLSEIVAGNGAAGILKLMQAAQMNPGILQDARFVNALQSVLASAKGPGSQPTAETTAPGRVNASTEQASLAAKDQMENFRSGAS